MGANRSEALHVHPRDLPVYDTDDLKYFYRIVNDIVGDYELLGSLSVHERAHLKARLAIAIFKDAATGERDYMRLKRDAVEAVSAVPSSYPDC